jgi:uncharacterized protein YjbI with pentapeptide repeats
MAKEVAASREWTGARFTDVDLAGAVFRDVNMSGVTIADALLVGADISGEIAGMRVNGVEVAPLIEAELDRRAPERVLLRAPDLAGLRDGWTAVERLWEPTMALARTLPEATRRQRVGDEWSLVETLRHLVFVTDAWFRWAVLGKARPYHRLGLAHASFHGGGALGIDTAAAPSFEEVAELRRERMGEVRQFLSAATDADLDALRRGNSDGDHYPPASEATVRDCLHVVMDEEWWHHQYATRDLGRLGVG